MVFVYRGFPKAYAASQQSKGDMTAINPKIRLFVEGAFHAGAVIPLAEDQAHYLLSVMRSADGTPLALFNGQDGEWLGALSVISKKKAEVRLVEPRKPQVGTPDVWYVFAPLKHGRIDFIVQKATELGASALLPVMTARTIASRVNADRLLANAIEAAEQSERLEVPVVRDVEPLTKVLAAWPEDRVLLYGDESGNGLSPLELFAQLPADIAKWGVLVGPEGGFTPDEFALLTNKKFARPISLGPRVLRADTAGLAALTAVMAWRGDWDKKPRFEG